MTAVLPQPTVKMTHDYALLLMERGDYGGALEILLLLTTRMMDSAQLWRNCGQCYEALGDYELSLTAFELCLNAHRLRRQQGVVRAHIGVGSNLYRLGMGQWGLKAFRKALAVSDDSPDARFQKSQVLMLLGEWERGWELYESRRSLPGWLQSVDYKAPPPEWNGKDIGRVLVYGEQGSGDRLFFSRWLDGIGDLSKWAYVVDCGDPVNSLLRFSSRSEADYSIPIASLPRVSGVPVCGPAIGELRVEWTKPTNEKPRVGVCWKGSPRAMHDKDRSSPIDFRDALQDERWEIVSLQVGYDFSPKDYLETAELMRTLDAVVTVDTSNVHVAGTLGVPTIVIPESSPDWRWGLSEDVSPWYPSVKVVRRTKVDAWSEAIGRAKREVSKQVL